MRKVRFAILALLLLACIGCEAATLARGYVQPDVNPGKFALAMKGTGEQLLQRGQIDLHRQITTSDGTVIDVWVLKAWHGVKMEQPKPALGTAIVLHGLGESKAKYPYFGAGERLAKLGYDVILPDLRYHGRSTGKYVTYGAKEKDDLKAVVDALADSKQISPPVYVFGANLGGTVAIQYAAIDDRCKGVMAVAPYQDFSTFVKDGLLLPDEKKENEVVEQAGKLGDFDPLEASAVKAAGKLKCPLLIVHGVLDLSVPGQHSEAIIAAAAGPKKLVTPVIDIRVVVLEDWIADNLDKLARTGLGP